jgi:hypothetical protein
VIGWGVVATGGIANVVTSDMLLVDDTEVRAVASRDLGRAQGFAAKYGIPKPYGDYRELIADPDVDVVYIASPHSGHYDVAKEALLAGKAVLCEKPITVTLAAAEELVTIARDRGVFLMEAMWTRFNPLVRKLRRLVADGWSARSGLSRPTWGALFPTSSATGCGTRSWAVDPCWTWGSIRWRSPTCCWARRLTSLCTGWCATTSTHRRACCSRTPRGCLRCCRPR